MRRRDWRVVLAGVCFLFLLSPDLVLHAQEEGRTVPGRVPGRRPAAPNIQYTGPHPFDILHYALDLSFAMTTEEMGGTVEITMVLKASTDSLVLHEAALRLDTVRVDGVRKSFVVDSTQETFTVRLGAPRNAGDTLRMAIAYQRLPGVDRPSDRRGYYYFVPDSVDGELPDTVGYTMSEPSDARFWMPCFDDPSEKGTAEINATAPAGFVAASNGKLQGVTEHGNGTVTWRWREDHQIVPYLMCVTISKWAVHTYPYIRAVNDTVPVQYYVFPSDSVAWYLPRVADMIGAFSKVYGDYPWDKYGMSGVTPFNFGGMEHQSMTTLHRFYETSDPVVSHELAHQWWGDLVTCGTWKDIWLNESFATYSEAVWQEHLGGFDALKASMEGMLNFSAGSWTGAVYDPEGQQFYIFSDLVYGKGAWVLHTLRGVLGDSLFFKTLLAYRQKFSEGSAVTEDLRAVVDSVSGTNMGWFFDQWIYGPGWPKYSFHSAWASDTVRLRIEQKQSDQWPVYSMPIQVRFYHGNADTTIVVQNSQADQAYVIPLPFSPDSVKVDPDSWILKQVVSESDTVIERTPLPSAFSLEQNYPNPFNPRTGVRFQVPGVREAGIGGQGPGVSVKLTVYDLLGREVAVLVDERKLPGTYEVTFDGSRLSSGIYICRMTGAGERGEPIVSVKRMLLLK